jgi:hypothetical protein
MEDSCRHPLHGSNENLRGVDDWSKSRKLASPLKPRRRLEIVRRLNAAGGKKCPTI